MSRFGSFVGLVLALWIGIVWLHDYTLGGGTSALSIACAAAGAAVVFLVHVFRG